MFKELTALREQHIVKKRLGSYEVLFLLICSRLSLIN